MIIYYKRYDKTPEDGDLKVLKNGKMFFRAQSIIKGLGYIVSNGRPVYDWYEINHERVKYYLDDFNRKRYSLYCISTKTKRIKTKVLSFDFSKEEDRIKYTKITGINVDENTTINKARLEVHAN